MRLTTKLPAGRAALLGAALLATSAVGCNTYSYVDFHAKIDPMWGGLAASVITQCHMYVTGAATDDFVMNDDSSGARVCPPVNSNQLEITRVNYSTFAESGNLTFTLKGFTSTGEKPECQIAEGTTTIAISKGNTAVGMDLILKPKTSTGTCQ